MTSDIQQQRFTMVGRYGIALFFLIMAIAALPARSTPSYQPGKIIVKLKENSPSCSAWFSAGRSGAISSLVPIAGAHTSTGYQSDAVLQAVTRAVDAKHATLQSSGIAKIREHIRSLKRIAVIEVSSAVNVRMLASKLTSLTDVEYAEPMPAHRLLSTPNDTLFRDQYYHRLLKTADAWEAVQAVDSILIAIIDTGIDYNHDEFKNLMFVNKGEDGNDAQGKSKRSNGVDDDNNGYIDDWHGWDFAGFSDGTRQDNDPLPGNRHGTHVAGLAAAQSNNISGGVGICNRAKLVACKVGGDPSFSTSVVNTQQAILYAGAIGAKVINCSWGSTSYSQADQETINTLVSLGVCVVAASGNNGNEEAFYPAGYSGVLSVCATGGDDRKTSFSNYHSTVALSSPGLYILSTYPNNEYGYEDGTSMASPIAAGVAAMVRLKYPSFTPEEVFAMMQATTDNIDGKRGNINELWSGKMGTGRVNVLRAVSTPDAKFMKVQSCALADDDGDNVFDNGDVVRIIPTYKNLLGTVANVRTVISVATSKIPLTFQTSSARIGSFSKGEQRTATEPFLFTVTDTIPENAEVSFMVTMYEDTVVIGRGMITAFLKPTYRTLRNNDIHITVNSNGNFGYNDYPTNRQGDGMTYKQSGSILFEAGLIAARNAERISDVARGSTQDEQGFSFRMKSPLVLKQPTMQTSALIATTDYADNNMFYEAGIGVTQNVYQYSSDTRANFILSNYLVRSLSQTSVDSMYLGVYSDWDIGESGKNNQATFDAQRGYYYVRNTASTTLPYVGMQLLSNQPVNAYMIDNDATTGSIGVYDGYTAMEKWASISSGLARTVSKIGDVSAVIGAGPFPIAAGDTVGVCFSIFAGMNLDDLDKAAAEARLAAKETLGINGAGYEPPPPALTMTVYPNPGLDFTSLIKISLPRQTVIDCEIIDLLGNTVGIVSSREQKIQGTYTYSMDSASPCLCGKTLSQGLYFVRLRTQYGILVEPFFLIR